jgi:hypothetical protein
MIRDNTLHIVCPGVSDSNVEKWGMSKGYSYNYGPIYCGTSRPNVKSTLTLLGQ